MVNVVFITDENYVMPTCVAAMSLILNYKGTKKLCINFLCDSISKESKNKLYGLNDYGIEINLKDVVDKSLEKLALNTMAENLHVTSTALLKFYLPEIFPAEDKILYLDGDIIVNGDISELFNIDVNDYCVAAVDDMGDMIFANGKSLLASRINLPTSHYFNSGVMLLNLTKMRSEDCVMKLIKYKKNGNNFFMDQDAFNYILWDKRKIIDYKYNFRSPVFYQCGFESVNSKFFNNRFNDEIECIKAQLILHLTDSIKPWIYYLDYFSDLFKKYYYYSPYKSEKLNLESPEKVFGKTLYNVQNKLIELEGIEERYKQLEKIFKRRILLEDWRFPYEKIFGGAKIILYGAGEVGKSFYKQLEYTKYCQVVLWVDRNYKSIGGNVTSPKVILTIDFDYVLIANADKEATEEIKNNLLNMGIMHNKVVILHV